MDIPNFDALQVIAEIALGLAGFSAVLVGLLRTEGKIEPPEHFRITALTYGSMGAVFFALLPFAIFTDSASQEMAWTLCALFLFIFSTGGLVVLPPRSLKLRKAYPELFPRRIIGLQIFLHSGCCISALVVLLNLTTYKANFYTASLLLLLLHSAIAFVRTLFYRKVQMGK